jgi:hypothetical protein
LLAAVCRFAAQHAFSASCARPPIDDHEIATAAAIRRLALRAIPPGRKITDFKK